MHESCFVRVSEGAYFTAAAKHARRLANSRAARARAVQPATGSELPAGRGFFEPGPISAAISRR
jgi:hypothetical protein